MKKILFGVAALGLLGLAGAGLGLKAQDAVEAKADEPTSYTVYFDYSELATTWGNPENIYCRYWNGSIDKWDLCSATKESYVVSFTFTLAQINNNGFAFRNTDSGKDDGNETRWIDKSEMIDASNFLIFGHTTIAEGVCTVSLKSADALAKNASTSPFIEYESPLSPSYETERVWTTLVDDSVSEWWTTAPVLRVGVGGVTYYYQMTSLVNSGVTYYYADIPLAREYANYIRPISGLTAWWNIVDVGHNGVAYIKDNRNGGQYIDTAGMPNVMASTAAVVLSGYTTCSDNANNGYNAYPALNTNFISQLKSGENLEDVNITDYRFHETGTTYSGSDIKDKIVTAQEKWDEMGAKYTAMSGSHSVTPVTKDSASPLLVAIIAVSTLGIGAFFIARKRRAE